MAWSGRRRSYRGDLIGLYTPQSLVPQAKKSSQNRARLARVAFMAAEDRRSDGGIRPRDEATFQIASAPYPLLRSIGQTFS